MTAIDKSLFSAILDQLIPGNPDRATPGAGQLGLAEGLVAKPELYGMICALLSQAQALAGEVSPDLVRQLETDQPEAFRALLSETYKAYYSRPDIRVKVGVGAHPVHPKGYDVARETAEQMDELTAPVRARGPIYRDPTGDAS
ncbi:hypothetical protein [Nioella sp.]|uniref:hypothetical protein n=1 Tax=Nioella sp. TaxID=1912091 RepID=UPI003A8B39F6